jgi:transglutaminase-like putative cysteine protease
LSVNKHYIAAFLVVLTGFCAFAQNFKPGVVTKEELEEKKHPIDSSAPAAILYKLGKTYFSPQNDVWSLVTEVTVRLKIYSKEGYRHAGTEIPYSTLGKPIKISVTNAYTYNLSGSEIIKTSLKPEGDFTVKVTDSYSKRKIIMPDVKEGSIIEYTYTINNPGYTISDWYFQYDIPVNYIEYSVSTPQYFTYNRYITGYVTIDKAHTIIKHPEGTRYEEYTDIFSAKNVKALKDEEYVNNIENYTAILKHELSATSFYEVQKYSTDWTSLCKTIYDDDKFGRELKLDSYFKGDMANLLSGAATAEEKRNRIFGYVRSRMTWDKKGGPLCEYGVKKAYETKTGNVSDINLMLTAMLREAGLEANPILVSTRDNGVALYPSYTAYDYVIAGVETDNGIVLLDATSKYSEPDILPLRALNWQGRMIRKNGTTKDVDLMPKKNSKRVISIAAAIDKDGIATGKVRSQRSDYYAYAFRENYADTKEDTYIENLEKKIQGLEVGAYKRTANNETEKPLTEEYDFTHKALSDVIGDKIYFNPMLFFTASKNPFTAEEREFPIDFSYPWQDRYMINIKLPEGYVIESLPAPLTITLQENIGSFKYNVASQNNTLQISVAFDINYANVSQDYYKSLRDFYKKMTEKQNEKIVLKKT